ncbi:MAG: endopeptidase La [Gammaproteobacteria bacterium]|nr:endopeptidase La [Gammaproteobacteria bacterium]
MDINKKSTKTNLAEESVKYLPKEICLLPITERPFFPPQTLPILMRQESWQETIDYIADTQDYLTGLILVKSENKSNELPDEFYKVGTLVKIHKPILANGKVQFIAEGIQRFRIKKWLKTTPPYMVSVEYPNEPDYSDDNELQAYGSAIINKLKELLPLNPIHGEEVKFILTNFDNNEPSELTDFAASVSSSAKEQLQDILETVHLKNRMHKVMTLINKELEVAHLQKSLYDQVESSISDHQRKFFLKEQLKAIQKELGIAKDDKTADIERFQSNMLGKELPVSCEQKFLDELDKLSVLESGSPEYAVTRNYLEVFSKVPWGLKTEDRIEIDDAKTQLDKNHSGLDDVKQRIIEFLAVAKLKNKISGSIILLVGPPGVGKTSIGRSIADAIERKFYRFSVGGMRDEAEIKGHRRTYIGAMPGKLVRALVDTETSNPVIMLDEIDKMGSSHQGDPSSALLEALDPEQNNQFLDHYLDVRLDLSNVLFICTANQTDTIPQPLLDRMEVIRLSGYLAEEKYQIAKNHLWPKQLASANLSNKKLQLTDAALKNVIQGYARDAGVRNLDKLLNKIIRKAAVEILGDPNKKIKVTQANLSRYVGIPLHNDEKLMSGVGICTGLAWTLMGGATLNIEAVTVHESGRAFKLTGQLGSVMKESAEIAYGYIAANLELFGLNKKCMDDICIHLHVPEGATPKDGPSAGITIATAIISLLSNKPCKKGYAMTGELTLTGKVLAVGGIREKLVAAKRDGLKNIILPKSVSNQYDKLPEYLKEGIKVIFCQTYPEVFNQMFRA